MPTDERPFTTFRFEVVLDLDRPVPGLASPLCDAAFAECDGLDMTMGHKTLEVGGVNDRQVHLIGPVTYGQLVLKRGMTGNLQLWSWFAQGTRPGSVLTAHGEVTAWHDDGTPAVQYTVTGCLPTRLRGPAHNAREGNLVAVEELTLVYERLVVSAPGGAVGSSIGAAFDPVGGVAFASAGASAQATVTGNGFAASASATASASASASAGASASASAGAGFGGGL